MNSLRTIAKLATLVVIGGGTIGAAVGITQAQSFHEAPQSAEAEVSQKTILTFIPGNEWEKSNADFGAALSGPNGNSFTIFEKASDYNNTKAYVSELDTFAYNGIRFIRMDPNKNDADLWNRKWNESIYYELDLSVNNVFKINNPWNNNDADSNKKGKATGVWSSTIPVSKSKINVWLKNPDNANWNSDGAVTALGARGGDCGAWTLFYNPVHYGDYFMFEVPDNISYFRFVRLDPSNLSNSGNWGQTDPWDFDLSKGIEFQNNRIYNIIPYSNNPWGFHTDLVKAKENTVSAEMFGKVLEPIVTCSPDSKTGYGAYEEIKNYFYNGMSKTEIERLGSITLKDVDHDKYYEQGNKYDGLGDTRVYTAKDKWKSLGDVVVKNGGQRTLDTNVFDNNVIVATSVTILGTSLIAGFAYLLKKRKINA